MSPTANLSATLAEYDTSDFHRKIIWYLAQYILGWMIRDASEGVVFQKPFGRVSVFEWDPFTKFKDYEALVQNFSKNPIWCADYFQNYGRLELEANHVQCMIRMVEIVEQAKTRLALLTRS